MPCNMVITNTVSWSEGTDVNLMRDAFAELGLEVQEIGGVIVGIEKTTGLRYRQIGYNPATHEFVTYGGAPSRVPEVTERMVKVAYSTRVVETMTRKFGWVAKKVGQNQYVATKRA